MMLSVSEIFLTDSKMDDPFSTPPQRSTRPASIGDRLRISKKTFIALLNSLPFHELDLQWQFISDDNDNSATVRFIRELGRALSNAQITPSAVRTSPKKLLSDTLDGRVPHRFLPSEEETPTKPRSTNIETPQPQQPHKLSPPLNPATCPNRNPRTGTSGAIKKMQHGNDAKPFSNDLRHSKHPNKVFRLKLTSH